MLWLTLTLLILGLYGISVFGRHLREAKLVRLRDMIHRERMAAMERNLPVSESGADPIEAILRGDERGFKEHGVAGDSTRGIRMLALALGLTSLLGGIATIPALYYQIEPEVQAIWPIGLIPAAIGIGLLLFVRVSRALDYTSSNRGETQ